jgi:6-phosphogluconolactonase
MISTYRPRNLPTWIDWHEFESPEPLADALSNVVADALTAGIAEHHQATLIISGGSTPRPFFKALSCKEIPWAKVNITLADERFVPATHADSNERLVRQQLLINRAAKARFVPLYQEGASAAQVAVKAAEEISRLHQPFEVLVLGMGNDGHTASLFPGSPLLAQALQSQCEAACLPMQPQEAPHQRITLTFPVLAGCRKIILHIAGEEKLKTLAQALLSEDVLSMPIRAFLKHPLSIYWSK